MLLSNSLHSWLIKTTSMIEGIAILTWSLLFQCCSRNHSQCQKWFWLWLVFWPPVVKVTVEMGVYTEQARVGVSMRKGPETLWRMKRDNRHKPNNPGGMITLSIKIIATSPPRLPHFNSESDLFYPLGPLRQKRLGDVSAGIESFCPQLGGGCEPWERMREREDTSANSLASCGWQLTLIDLHIKKNKSWPKSSSSSSSSIVIIIVYYNYSWHNSQNSPPFYYRMPLRLINGS